MQLRGLRLVDVGRQVPAALRGARGRADLDAALAPVADDVSPRSGRPDGSVRTASPRRTRTGGLSLRPVSAKTRVPGRTAIPALSRLVANDASSRTVVSSRLVSQSSCGLAGPASAPGND